MANATAGNKIYVTAAGSLTENRTQVAYVFFTGGANNDAMILGESVSGPPLLKIQADGSVQTVFFDTSRRPMVFNGIYVQSISSGAVATIVTTQSKDT